MGTTLHNAILLLGPTGAGKTPLGNYLETHGLNGRNCYHFDFGANLRLVAKGKRDGFTEKEVDYLQDVLEKGALLEAETFYLAEKILTAFVETNEVGSDEWIVLNGLPRHSQQADAIADRVDVEAVVELVCSPETVVSRILQNAGGDRSKRADDQLDLVRKKLAIYAKRTVPLLAYYQGRGVPVIRLPIHVKTQPPTLAKQLAEALQRGE